MDAIKSKNGYALIITMMFLIILTIAGLALYTSTQHMGREIRIHGVGYVKGQYAAIAGLRYAAMLLEDPANLFPSSPEHNGQVYTVPSNDIFFTNTGIDGERLTISITEWNTGETEWPDGEYHVEAAYE